MERERGNGERFTLLYFLIFSLFPPSISISYNKNYLILSLNVKCDTFVANIKTYHTRLTLLEILDRIRWEKAPQVLRA